MQQMLAHAQGACFCPFRHTHRRFASLHRQAGRAQELPSASAAPVQPQPLGLQQQRQEPEQLQNHQEQQLTRSCYAKGCDVGGLDEDIKIIGFGQRGISASSRLLANKSLQGAEFWLLDTDAKVFNAGTGFNCVQVPLEDDAQLTAEQLSKIAGSDAATAAAAARQGAGSPVNPLGVAFLLAAAGAIPGGSTLLLQVAAYFRRAGYFVVVALTRPFDFEGKRKVEEASALIEALQDVANLVVAVPQAVLTRASAELTITEASEIADITLESSCRAILWALGVPEVLLASHGGMLWHGRDLRQYKRLLSPPMELLGTCPGVGHLGRGYASLPVDSLAAAGLASGLSTLAEDAVLAALDSPFLDNVMPCASGVLCVLSLPTRVLSHDFDKEPSALNDPEKYAIRAAVQVAAMTVVEVVGPHCEEVVVCAHVRHDWPYKDPKGMSMEATLLVIEDPAAAEEKEDAAGASSNRTTPATAAAAAAARIAGKSSSGPILHSALSRQQPKQQPKPQKQAGQQPQQPQQQPTASRTGRNWTAMSAIAGGSAAAAVGQYRKQPPNHAAKERMPYSSASAARKLGSNSSTGGRQAFFKLFSSSNASSGSSSSNSNSSSPQSNAAHGSSSSSHLAAGRPGPGAVQHLASSTSGQGQQQQQSQEEKSPGDVQFLPRMANKYVDTMVAQSLDLPPSAARWRHHQRRHTEQQAARRASGHFPVAAVPWTSAKKAGSDSDAPGVEGFVGSTHDIWDEEMLSGPKSLRSRVAGMLQKERQSARMPSWDEEGA